MMTYLEALALKKDLKEKLKGVRPYPGVNSRTMIRRPPLNPPDSFLWDIRKAVTPVFAKALPISDLHEVFCSYVDEFMTPESRPRRKPSIYLREVLGIGYADMSWLFPRQSLLRDKEIRSLYGLGVLLWCAFTMGYQILYGKSWVIVYGDGYEFGIDDGQIVCGYPNLCRPVPLVDWTAFFEETRGGDPKRVEPPESRDLYSQAMSADKKIGSQDYTMAVSALVWMGFPYQEKLWNQTVIDSRGNFRRKFLDDEILGPAIDSAEPLKTLKRALVPRFISSSSFYKLSSKHMIDAPFWNREQCKDVVLEITEGARKIMINNKKGKPNVDSNYRKGGGW